MRLTGMNQVTRAGQAVSAHNSFLSFSASVPERLASGCWRQVIVATALFIGCYATPANAQVTQTVFTDDFELALPNPVWNFDPNGNDTATTGDWEIANPNGTDFQNDEDGSGNTTGRALVTDGGNATNGDLDIDAGFTTVRSPSIAIPGTASTAELSFDYYFADSADNNEFQVIVNSTISGPVPVLFRGGNTTTNQPPEYGRAIINLSAFIGETITFDVIADGSNGSLTEASVDNVLATATFIAEARLEKTNNADGDSFFNNFEYMPAGTSPVVFRVEVFNESATNSLTINSLVDDIHGNLAVLPGSCSTLIGLSIPVGGSAFCVFTASVSLPTEGTSELDTVTAGVTQGGVNSAVSDTSVVGVLAATPGPAISETFYVPYPEDQILTDLQGIRNGGVGQCGDGVDEPVDPITTLIGITILAENTVIYYDHIEDGFEPVLDNPVQSTTLVWGDGDLSNGIAPGFPTDIISAGSEIVLRNDVVTTTLDSVIDFDGGDKFAGSLPIAATRAAWADGSETLLAGALEMYNTNEQWGTSYVFPIGEDESFDAVFQYVGASITAQADNTVVDVDADGDGTLEIVGAVINEGESLHIAGGVELGGTVTASLDVSVDMITGDVCENYESRFYTLFPRDDWTNNYYNPILSQSSGDEDAVVYLYNPHTIDITVTVDLADGSGGVNSTDTVAVNAGAIQAYVMPDDSGARFYTDPSENGGATPEFYAIVAVDQDNDELESSSTDWGITLIPRQFLSTQVLVGTGLGRDPNSIVNPNENGSPIWLTVAKDGSNTAINGVDICVDYDGDGFDSAADVLANPGFYNQGVDDRGDLDPTTGTGREYDNRLNLEVFESVRIFDPDGDQSGMLLFVCDADIDDERNGVITASWGQDAAVASAAEPALDMGTGVPNLRTILVSKRSEVTGDINGDGDPNLGDRITYQIDVTNTGLVPNVTTSVEFIDFLPSSELAYVAGSTTITYVDPIGGLITTDPVADDSVPPESTIYPLDLEGTPFLIPVQIPIGETVTFTYEADVVGVPLDPNEVCNIAQVSVFNEFDEDEECIVASRNNSTISGFVREDTNTDGVGDAPIAGVTILLYSDPLGTGNPADGTVQRTVQTDVNGFYEFIDLQAGDYIVVEIDPATYQSVGDLDESGTNDVDTVANLNQNDNIIPVSLAQSQLIGDPTIVLGSRDIENNFVDSRAGLISGLVWLDEDQDGINDIEEAGLTNIIVELRDGSCTPGSDCPTVITDQFGNYVFSALPPGNYDIAVISGLPSDVTITAGPFGFPVRSVTLPGAGEVTGEDFGYIADPNTGIIGDRVWSDADGDGIQDPGEAGLAGVTLTLLDNTGSPTGLTATTNADGDYLFTGVPFGDDYTVVVDSSNANPGNSLDGFTPTVGPQSEGGFVSNPVTLSPALTTVTDIDFGFDSADTLTINDRVWYDTDGDQVQDAGEPGIAGVSIDLLDDSGNVVATTVTDDNGDFTFTGIPEGNDYTLLVSDRDNELDGLSETTSTGGDETITGSLDAAAGDNVLNTVGDDGTPTFGYNNPGLISGTLWSDADASGLQNDGEAGIGGITVTLTPPAGVDLGNGDGQPITTVTAPDGSYAFDGLPPGDYNIDVLSPPAGVHTEDPDSDDDNNTAVSLGLGDSAVNQDFGYNDSSLFDISGTVFLDTDKDGVEEEDGVDGVNGTADDEPGFAGVTIDLLDASGNVIASTISAADGTYLFPDLPDAVYQVVVTDQDGLLSGYDITSGLDNQSVTLAGADEFDVDFGYIKDEATGSISGEVFIDEIDDDLANDEETNLANVDVYLCSAPLTTLGATVPDNVFAFDRYDGALSNTGEIDSSGVFRDSGTTASISILPGDAGTDNFGYVFTGFLDLPEAGLYGFETTSDDGSRLFIDGVEVVDNDGFHGPTTVSGTIMLQAGLHAIEVRYFEFGGGESLAVQYQTPTGPFEPIPSSIVSSQSDQCFSGHPNLVATTTTDANGEYVFANLPSGSYEVGIEPSDIPPGLVVDVSTPPVALSEGENVTGVDAGYVSAPGTGVLSGFVWTDVNGDGIYDPAEAPIPGVEIIAYSTNTGTLVELARGITGPNGQWIVSGIPIDDIDLQDNLIVTYDDDDIPSELEPTQPTNLPLGDDLYNPVNLFSDDDNNISFLDFGFPPVAGQDLGSISGTIYSDSDEDDSYTPAVDGELEGVTLNLLDSSGNIIATTKTDANGDYIFDGLLDGDYQVEVTDLDSVLRDLNPNDDVLNGGPSNDPVPITVSIVGAADVTNQDAGYVSDPNLGSIGNRFWFDIDGDGVIDDNEPGVEGVTIQVWLDNDLSETPDDPSGTTNAPEPGVDNLVRTVTTDENGEYYLTSLPAGQYIVVVTDANGFDEVLDGTVVPGGTGDGLAKPWTYALTKVDGAPNLAADFGVTGSNQLSGNVFIEDEDLVEPNGNSAIDPGELDGTQGGPSPDSPAEGVVVVLFIEQPDGSFDEIQSTTTDANGDYSFTGLPDGNYRVEVLPNGSPIDGFGQTGDPDIAGNPDPELRVCDSGTATLCDDSAVVSLSGTPVTGIDFGYQKNFATTPVTINTFLSEGGYSEVNFSWETSNEVGHIGYQLYARTDEAWVLLNDQLIVQNDGGDALQTRSYNYTAYNVDAQWFALVDVSTTEELTVHGPYALGQRYGAAVIEAPEFDWSDIKLTAPSAVEVNRATQRRIDRLRNLEVGDSTDDEAGVDEEELPESAAETGGPQL